MIKYCNTCLLSDKEKQVCLLSGIPIDLDKDFCSKHTKETTPCDICGRAMIKPDYFEYDCEGNLHQYCERCHQMYHTCQLCPNCQKCEFETNPDPMPKFIMKTTQQGNMIMQAQVRNEERVKKFCHSCVCWLADGVDACGKTFNVGCYKQPNFWNDEKRDES